VWCLNSDAWGLVAHSLELGMRGAQTRVGRVSVKTNLRQFTDQPPTQRPQCKLLEAVSSRRRKTLGIRSLRGEGNSLLFPPYPLSFPPSSTRRGRRKQQYSMGDLAPSCPVDLVHPACLPFSSYSADLIARVVASSTPSVPTASSATPHADERLVVVIASPLHDLALGELRATPPLHGLALVKLCGCEEKLAHAHRVRLRDVAQDGDLAERTAQLHHHRPSFTYEQLRVATAGFDVARKLRDGGFETVFLTSTASLRSAPVLNSEREEKGERRGMPEEKDGQISRFELNEKGDG
jgi:hypothetical protein